VPITTARAKLTELADQWRAPGRASSHSQRESYVAIVTAGDYDELMAFRHEQHLSVLRAVAEGLEDVNAQRTMSWDEFRPHLHALRQRVRTRFGLPALAAHEPRPATRRERRPMPRRGSPTRSVIESADRQGHEAQARRMSLRVEFSPRFRGRWTASRSTTSRCSTSIPTQALRSTNFWSDRARRVPLLLEQPGLGTAVRLGERWVRRQCRRRASCRACGTRKRLVARQCASENSGCCMLSKRGCG